MEDFILWARVENLYPIRQIFGLAKVLKTDFVKRWNG